MTHLYFIYGNQQLEIDEEVNTLIDSLIPENERENSSFQFDTGDFFSNDRGKAQRVLSDFQNTCETVSFFSTAVVVHLKDLQKIPSKKSPVEAIEKSLNDISLVKIPLEDESVWFNAETLKEPTSTHHHVTGKQIVKQIVHCGGKSFYLELDSNWNNRLVYQKKGNSHETIEIKDFLSSSIKGEIRFDLPDESLISATTNDRGFVSLIKEYLTSPPQQVEFIFTANIKNTRELNKEIFELLNSKAKTLKKTIAYDDFRPVGWIIDRAKKKNMEFNQITADLLIEIAGTDFSVLDMELEKLSILLPHGNEISPEKLLESVSHSKRFGIFRVSNFLVQKDLKNTLECLEQLLKNQASDSVSIFSLIAAQFRRMLSIAWMREEGLIEKTIIGNLKINEWVAKQTIRFAEKFSLRELENIVIHLAKYDLQIKYSVKDAINILENISFQICLDEFKDNRHIDRHWLP
ncbi:DNA polymerase III subunit delta [bacterium]|nr:DNA polymerase III subunit delta [bacterium]